ncbi:unnamed protein product [Blepharisma stoltei]|uniref:Uncharacterized protein n=1 Tax=Blepharisma stoltei TaxID=1481888 RepID=A0AAU9IKI7_9CILI|nr:unnamed protein product [Blepharisma stoltei]
MSGITLRSNESQIPILLDRLQEISQSLERAPHKRSSFRADPESIMEDYLADVSDARKKAQEAIKLARKFHKAYQKSYANSKEFFRKGEELQEKIEEMESQIRDQQSELISREQRCDGLTSEIADLEKLFKNTISENSQLKREINSLKREITQKEQEIKKKPKKSTKNENNERESDKALQNEIVILTGELKRQVEEIEDLHFKLKEVSNLLQIEKSASERLRNFITQIKNENFEHGKEIEELKIEKSMMEERILGLKNELVQMKTYNEQLEREYDNQRRRATLTEIPKELNKTVKMVIKEEHEEESDKESGSIVSDESESEKEENGGFSLEIEEYNENIHRADTRAKTAPAPVEETLGDYLGEEEEESNSSDNPYFMVSSPTSKFSINGDSSPKDNKVFFLSSPKANYDLQYPSFQFDSSNDKKICHCDDISVSSKPAESKRKEICVVNSEILIFPKAKAQKHITQCEGILIEKVLKPELQLENSEKILIKPKEKPTLHTNEAEKILILPKEKPKLQLKITESMMISPEEKPILELKTIEKLMILPKEKPKLELKSENKLIILPKEKAKLQLNLIENLMIFPKEKAKLDIKLIHKLIILPKEKPKLELKTNEKILIIPVEKPKLIMENFKSCLPPLQKPKLQLNQVENLLILAKIKPKKSLINCGHIFVHPLQKVEVEQHISDKPTITLQSISVFSLSISKQLKKALAIISMNSLSLCNQKLPNNFLIANEKLISIPSYKQKLELQNIQKLKIWSLPKLSYSKNSDVHILETKNVQLEVQSIQTLKIYSPPKFSCSKNEHINILETKKPQLELQNVQKLQIYSHPKLSYSKNSHINIWETKKTEIKPCLSISSASIFPEKPISILPLKSLLEVQNVQNTKLGLNSFLSSSTHDQIHIISPKPKPQIFQKLPKVAHPLQAFSFCYLESIFIRSKNNLSDNSSINSDDTTSSRRSRLNAPQSRDPIKEFFIFTCQAAKLNSKYKDRLGRVPVNSLYSKVLEEGIPFNKWHDYVQEELHKEFGKC